MLTVGATNRDDESTYFSNWGKCVNVLAPGQDIPSITPGNKTGVMSGTSFSSPLVAGVAALILSENPTFKPETLKKVIQSTCKSGVLKKVRPDTLNCLVQSVV